MYDGIATLSWSLLIDCNCGETFDLAEGDHDVDGRFSIPIFNNKWNDLEGEEAICPKCGNVVPIKKVEY